jgi:copper chaperone
MATATYNVAGMSCSHCERAVTDEITKLDGVDSIDVSAETGVLRITSRFPLADEAVLAAVDEAGYTAVRG